MEAKTPEGLDSRGYPTTASIDRIKRWPMEDFEGLAKYLVSLWYYPEGATLKDGELVLVTSGWSGNESLIDAIPAEWQMMYWARSERGGLHVYQSRERMRRDTNARDAATDVVEENAFLKATIVLLLDQKMGRQHFNPFLFDRYVDRVRDGEVVLTVKDAEGDETHPWVELSDPGQHAPPGPTERVTSTAPVPTAGACPSSPSPSPSSSPETSESGSPPSNGSDS